MANDCYCSGTCGRDGEHSFSECLKSNPACFLKNNDITVYVAVLNGNVKDNFMAIGFSEKDAKEEIIEKYYEEKGHTEEELNAEDIHIDVAIFEKGVMSLVY